MQLPTAPKSDRTTSDRTAIHDAPITEFFSAEREILNEKCEVQGNCFLLTTGLVSPLPHSDCALRNENQLSGKGLPPGLLCEGFAHEQVP